MVKVFVQKMQIKNVGFFLVFFVLCCGILGSTFDDKEVIQGIISGFRRFSPSKQSDETLVEALRNNCRHELTHLKQVYGDLGFSIPEAVSSTVRKKIHYQVLSEKDVKKVLSVLDPKIKKSLYRCLREHYDISLNSGAKAVPVRRLSKHPGNILATSNPTADSRRQLAEAPPPKSSKGPKKKGPSEVDTFVITIPVPEASPALDSGTDTVEENGGGSNTIVIVAVVVTAVATFSIALILFLCFRNSCGGGSGIDHKDDKPLLCLSMSNSGTEIADSASKRWAIENSGDKENIGNQLYSSNINDAPSVASSGGKSSVEAFNENFSTELSRVASEIAPRQSISALKPPPGRISVSSSSGLPPLKPPPGRAAEPLPPEPPAPPRPPAGPTPPPPPPPKRPAAPPPPPPKKAGGPPPPGPPPPPPPKKGGPGGPHAPPPPKGGGPPRPPPPGGKAGSSSDDADASAAAKAKLKPFFWDKVMANPDHSMVWDQIKAGSFQFNEDMIESLFGYAAAEKNDKKKDLSKDPPPPLFIQLIDPKKAQNLSILLRALNVTTVEVRDAIQEGNELPSELLETLLKMAPTAEEELKLRLFDGEMSQLGPADRFLKAMVDIPFAFRRIESLLFMGTLEEEATTIKYNLTTLEAACKELRSCRLFLKLLEAVLKTGNRMNDGTYRGGAQAFKLDTLLKLADVKGTDGKTTLLHFVVQEIVRSEGMRAARALRDSQSMSSFKSEDFTEEVIDDSEDHFRTIGLDVVSGVGDQLQNVRKAACMDSDSVTGTIAKLGSGLLKAKSFLNKEMDGLDENNGFHQALKSFVEHAEGGVMQLLEDEKRIMALVKSTADYFHGNSGKEEGLRLFIIVRDFVVMLEKVCREVKARPKWPSKPKKKEPPSRQTSSETPRTSVSSDIRERLFPAIVERRKDGSSSDDD